LPRVTRVDDFTLASTRVKGVDHDAWKKLSTLRAASGGTAEIVAFVTSGEVEKFFRARFFSAWENI